MQIVYLGPPKDTTKQQLHWWRLKGCSLMLTGWRAPPMNEVGKFPWSRWWWWKWCDWTLYRCVS